MVLFVEKKTNILMLSKMIIFIFCKHYLKVEILVDGGERIVSTLVSSLPNKDNSKR